MDKLRLRFQKAGKAVYISHLDLMRVVQRIFLRAGTPIKYSEGFNPHALISICLPLSVGMASECELMDFRVTREVDLAALPETLNAVSPEGVRFLAAYEPERKAALIKWLRVRCEFEYDSRDALALLPRLEAYFSSPEVKVTRRTKRGEGEFDLAPHLRDMAWTARPGLVQLECLVSAQEPTVNPELLTASLRERAPELAPDFARFTRLETYDGNMEVFR